MKKMMIGAAAFVLMGLSAQAATVVAKVANVNQTIRSVELLDNGSLKITKWNTTGSIVGLKSEVAQDLIYTATNLASVELQTETHQIVCMMILPVYENHTLYVANEQGQMSVVLTAQSCALNNVTHPVEKYSQQLAEKFRGELMILATQLSN